MNQSEKINARDLQQLLNHNEYYSMNNLTLTYKFNRNLFDYYLNVVNLVVPSLVSSWKLNFKLNKSDKIF